MNIADLSGKLLLSNIVYFSCSETGLINSVSDNVHTVFSKSAVEFTGKNVLRFIPRMQREEVLYNCFLIQETGKAKSFILSLFINEKETTSFCIRVSYHKDVGFLCVLMPAGNRLNGQDEKSFRQLEVMRTTLESIDDFVFVLDHNGLFSEFYSHTNKLLLSGFSSSFKVGSPLSEVGFPDHVAELFNKAIIQTRSTRKPTQINYSIRAFGGELFYLAKISPRFTLKDEFEGVTIVLRDITTSVKSEKQLKNSLDYYLTVLDNFPNPIWRSNALKRLDYFNKTWVEFTGIEAHQQHEHGWHKSVFPQDLQRVIQEFDEKFSARKPFSLEYRLIHHSGNYRWVKNFCQPLYDYLGHFAGYMGSCFDIDEITTTQNLLQESESRYRAMVQEQSDLVVRWKSDMSISFVNRSFKFFFNKNQQQLIGQNWLDLFDESQRMKLRDQIGQFINGNKTGFFETEIPNANNHILVYQWLNSPICNKQGIVIEYQSVGRDITEKIEKERENQNLLLRLNEKVKELSLLNLVSRYIHDGVGEQKLFKNLTNDISRSFLIPSATHTLIEYKGHSYSSLDFAIPAKYSQISYMFDNQRRGKITVYRDLEVPRVKDAEFIEENEWVLIKTVCEMLNSYFLKLEADKRLKQSELRFSELFENVMDIVFSTDGNGKILKINSAANKILGYTSFDGKSLWDFAVPSEKKSVVSLLEKAIQERQQSFTFETRILSIKGDIVFLQIGGIIKYDEQGGPLEIFGIARNNTERRKLEQNIMKTVITTEEKERKRFAEDLHDGIGPLLSGLKMYLQQGTLENDLNEKQQKVLKYCRELVDEAIGQTRSIANNLTPSVLNDFGLEKALHSHVSKINAIGKFTVNLDIKITLEHVENDVALAVYRIVSELINNALKHADCKSIDIIIDIRETILSMIYMDDGRGFATSKRGLDNTGAKLGINSIYNRVHSLNGSIILKSQIGEGVFVKIYLPLKG